MTPINRMQLCFPSRSANEGFARLAVAGFVSQLDPTLDELAEIKTIVSEAVTNCTVHAYKDTIGLIYITVRYSAQGEVSITIKDCGAGIDDVDAARAPLYTSCNTGERAGMGFTIMESFSDKLKVRSKKGKGTALQITKFISQRK